MIGHLVKTAAALAGLGILLPAQAYADIVVADCKLGGCSCYLSPVPVEDLELGLDMPLVDSSVADPPGATLVIDNDHGALYWTDASRGNLNRFYGGDGECPIELFPDDPLIPRDGLWRWNTVSTAVRGCPPMLAGMFANTGALDLAHSERVTWNGQFNPARFAGNADMSAYTWVDRGNQSWATVPIADSGCSDGACQSISIQLWMTLVSETKTRGHLTYDMEISGASTEARQVLAATGMGTCKVVVRYEIDHVAD